MLPIEELMADKDLLLYRQDLDQWLGHKQGLLDALIDQGDVAALATLQQEMEREGAFFQTELTQLQRAIRGITHLKEYTQHLEE